MTTTELAATFVDVAGVRTAVIDTGDPVGPGRPRRRCCCCTGRARA